MNIRIFILAIFIIVIFCKSKNKTFKAEHENFIGFFDERKMNLCILNETTGIIDSLVHIEDSVSGLYRKTVWSPDGSQFAFTGTLNGVNGTYTADQKGQNKKLVLEPKGDAHEGVLEWHPDLGLIFVMKNIDGNAEIYSVTDSLNLTNLTNLPTWEFFPALFPDGRISFVSNMDEAQNSQPTFKNVYVYNPDSSSYKFLLSMEGMSIESMSGTGIFPDISPDGQLMCFTLDGDIYTINIDGTNMKNITNTAEKTELTPSFSLDGAYIVFSGSSNSESENFNLFKINIKTLKKTQLTFGDNNYFTHPLYQPL